MLGPLVSAFAELEVEARHIVYADDAVTEVRAELLELDGVLVWVNPIHEGANRALLDAMLRDVAADGVWVSAHPDVIDTMGTKEVLFSTRHLGWGVDTAIYRTPEDLAAHLPSRLAQYGRLVVKQARGTGGKGVWRLQLPGGWSGGTPSTKDLVLVQRADPRLATPLEGVFFGAFLEDCQAYFEWSGCLIDQPYQNRLAEGMIRAYFVHDEVVGFCHQWPRGLLAPSDVDESAALAVPTMDDPDTPAFASLRLQAEREWVPEMTRLLGLSTEALPVIWDADFLYGSKAASGEDTFVLCEINVQAVWPYPPQCALRLAKAATARLLATQSRRW